VKKKRFLSVLLLPLNAFASDMAGLALGLIVVDVTILIVLAIFSLVMFGSKKALKFVYFLDFLVVLQAPIVLSHNWRLEDDVFMLNVFLFQILSMCLISILFYKHVGKISTT